jgi:hypothetical protein
MVHDGGGDERGMWWVTCDVAATPKSPRGKKGRMGKYVNAKYELG